MPNNKWINNTPVTLHILRHLQRLTSTSFYWTRWITANAHSTLALIHSIHNRNIASSKQVRQKDEWHNDWLNRKGAVKLLLPDRRLQVCSCIDNTTHTLRHTHTTVVIPSQPSPDGFRFCFAHFLHYFTTSLHVCFSLECVWLGKYIERTNRRLV